ncbi:MAG: hypothetical protein WCR67_05160 [Bacilli bacterium]
MKVKKFFIIEKKIIQNNFFVDIAGSGKLECDFKKFLFELSLKFCGTIEIESYDIYCEIVKVAEDILKKSYLDNELNYVYQKCKTKYTFTELKKIKDNDYQKFLELKRKLK